MGSEMCIRDSICTSVAGRQALHSAAPLRCWHVTQALASASKFLAASQTLQGGDGSLAALDADALSVGDLHS